MAFADDYALSKRAEQYQDEVYQMVWPGCEVEARHSRDEGEEVNILDEEFAIDVEIRLPSGGKLTGQEKALRHEHVKFNTFTIEFYQNRHTKEPGEFFHISCQYFLHSYWNKDETGFCKWRIINMLEFMSHLQNVPVSVLETTTRKSSSRASFYYVDYGMIPTKCVFRSSEDYKKKDDKEQLPLVVDN